MGIFERGLASGAFGGMLCCSLGTLLTLAIPGLNLAATIEPGTAISGPGYTVNSAKEKAQGGDCE